MNTFTKRREPFTFMLYLGMFGSSLLFVFIFFVFMKKEFINQNIPIALPKVFWLSSFAILLSSALLYYAKKCLQNENFGIYKWILSLTLCSGILFFVFQLVGWRMLNNTGITMGNNTGGAFIYIFSGLHLLHSFIGIMGLLYVVIKAFKNYSYVDAFVYSVNPPNVLRLKLVSIYWHFLDILWIVIFLFILYHAS